MQYLFTGIELHPDMGFGVTADSYYNSAEQLMIDKVEPQSEMPQNFLFRHSIELYLKSLIIIFHRKLKIDYGNSPFDSEEPEIYSDGQWRKLYSSHFIDKLYEYWLNYLLLPNIEDLNNLASKGDWQENKRITDLLAIICKYDRDSSYFRYPATKVAHLDNEKFSMKKLEADTIDGFVEKINKQEDPDKKGSFTMLIVDDDDNIVQAFGRSKNILSDVRDALKEVAHYFFCIHTMTRMTLCEGM